MNKNFKSTTISLLISCRLDNKNGVNVDALFICVPAVIMVVVVTIGKFEFWLSKLVIK